MPYRDFTLPDGSMVRTRISDEGTLAWYKERDELAKKGYPDRPPDVDTDTMRSWAASAPERDEEIGAVTSWPLAVVTMYCGPTLPGIKAIISWLSPGEAYMLRVTFESQTLNLFDAKEKYFTADQVEALNLSLENVLKGMNLVADLSAVLAKVEPKWTFTLPSEAVGLEQLMTEAVDEFKQEYGDAG